MRLLKSKRLLVGLLSVVVSGWVTYDLSKLPLHRHLRFDVRSAKNLEIQMYYDTGKGFNQQESSLRRVESNDTFITVRSPLLERGTRRVRVDFSSDTRQLRFRNFCITNRHNEEIKRFALPAIHKFINLDSHTIENGVLSIGYTGGDPQIIFDQDVLHFGQHFYWPLFVASIFIFHFFLNSLIYLYDKSVRIFTGLKSSSDPKAKEPSTVGLRFIRVANIVGLGLVLSGAYWHYFHPSSFFVPIPAPQTKTQFIPAYTPQEFFLVRPDGLKIATFVYDTQKTNPHLPPILLLHGKYPLGSRFPLYQVLTEKLVSRGYYVMAIDFAGYGHSQNPLDLGTPAAIDMNLETRLAVEHLAADPRFNSTGVAILGHSMGCGPGLAVAETNTNIRNLVLIGPPRRVYQRFRRGNDLHFFWEWQHHVSKKLYGHDDYPDWYTREFWRQNVIERDIVNHLPFISSGHHPPIMLVDGELEPEADRQFLQWYYCRSSHPKKLITLQRTNHPCNVHWEGHEIFYDEPVMETLVDQIDAWLTQKDQLGGRTRDGLNNFLDWLFAHHLLHCRAYEEMPPSLAPKK